MLEETKFNDLSKYTCRGHVIIILNTYASVKIHMHVYTHVCMFIYTKVCVFTFTDKCTDSATEIVDLSVHRKHAAIISGKEYQTMQPFVA